ncbi:P-loop NTPase fold protein [Saccharothrix syringae]|uniref:P-loop NTPase fold protein n=1 Tax=Saccharothrix syringae TaxID=103733 RepID=UPI0005265CCA|nr:P-loop NTPase fold protein [Saccharothrix syringae]
MVVGVAATDRPWELGVEALVVSVGHTLGGLGSALAAQFPDFLRAVDEVELPSIRSSRPRVLRFHGAEPLRLAVLASPEADDGEEVDLGAVRTATQEAVLAANRAGARSLAVPLLATGVLGLSHAEVAAVALPAIINALRDRVITRTRRVLLIGLDPEVVPLVEDLWNGIRGPEIESRPAWVAEDEPADAVPDELAGGVTSDLVDPVRPIPLERDRLGVTPYVSMLAAVVAERATPTPLSIGVFGEWGSGKSFFMGMLRGRIEELAGTGDARYCRRIVQIGFNAWHYADTNLWASLADVIFRGLADPEPGAEAQRGELQRLLAEKVGGRAELEEAGTRAEAEVARLRARVDEADGAHVTGARDLLAALRGSEQVRARLDRVWRRIGVADDVERARLLSDQLQDAHADAVAVRRVPGDRNGRIALAAAGAVLGLSALAGLAVPLVALVGGAAGAALAALGGGLLARARTGLGELRALSEDLRGGLDRIHDERVRAEAAELMDRLREAEADHLVAQAQLDEVVAHVGELGRRLAELNPARRASEFLRDRGDAYTGGLGVVSALRKDFEQLVALLADWRANPDADSARRPIDRVVLHVDDLDRCEPRQVVQVLEAVHLLLAMDLFVVVVGVDPRWLVRALRSHYADLLDGAGSELPTPPEDYLEKIVNIPFTLPGMVRGTLGHVLRSMVDGDSPTPAATPVPAAEPAPPSDLLTIERDAVLAHPQRPARPLTEGELRFLDALDPLVRTPRAAKRLFNVYRMIRASRDLGEAAAFLGDDDRPGEFQAVVVLLGIVAATPALAAAALTAPPGTGVRGGLLHRDRADAWSSFAADLAPRDGRSPVVGALTDGQAEAWFHLHRGLQEVTALVTLPDLAAFQDWAPHVRRFSYSSR